VQQDGVESLQSDKESLLLVVNYQNYLNFSRECGHIQAAIGALLKAMTYIYQHTTWPDIHWVLSSRSATTSAIIGLSQSAVPAGYKAAVLCTTRAFHPFIH